MSEDARFEDADEKPLNLGAMDPEDLAVVSALVQDAVLTGADMSWDGKNRRFSLLVNRLRHEGLPMVRKKGRLVERVRAVLLVDDVLGVSSQGIDRHDGDTVMSLLSVSFEPSEAPSGQILMTFAGDGALRLNVEALEVRLRDVTRPYAAPSGKVPHHPD